MTDDHADLRWFADVVWGPGTARVGGGAGERSYLLIPSASKARFLVPAWNRTVAVSALRSFNALRPPTTRAARSALALVAKAGAAGAVFRQRLEVDPGAHDALTAELGRVLGVNQPVVAAGIAPRGPNRKPVLQVFSARGEPAGFVKIGWNDVTRARVERETGALRFFEGREDVIRVPRALHLGEWRGLALGATAPLPGGVRRVGSSDPLVAEAARIARSGEAVDGDVSYVEELSERVGRREGEVGRGLAEVVEALGQSGRFPVGPWHGDWVPWNLARSGDALYALDWEHWSPRAPVGLDLIHWAFQLSFIVDKRPPRRSLLDALAATAPHLEGLGVGRTTLVALTRAYVAEIGLRAEEAVAAGAPPNPRFHPRLPDLLGEVASPRLEDELTSSVSGA